MNIVKTLQVTFDEQNPDLRHSKFTTPSLGWVDGIRKKFPEIWESGDNGTSDDAFYTWKDYESGVRSEATDKWLVMREKWAESHKEDGTNLIDSDTCPTLAKQMVNMIKWGVVGNIGLDNIISVISDLIDGKVHAKNINFEKMHGDYPETAADNAKKALAWKDEHSDRNKESIWALAEKYVSGQKFTEFELRSIARFESQKEHAGKKYKSIEPVLYDAVGGTNGIIWAKRIIQGIDSSKKKIYNQRYKAAADALKSEHDVKHIRNVEETADSYIIEFGKSDDDIMSEEEDYVESEKVDSVPSYLKLNAKRGLSLLEHAGGGLTEGTKREARAMVEGSVSDGKVVRMSAWFLRHKDDLSSSDASAYLRGDSDKPTAGQVAWLLWGGDLSASNRMRAQKWAESKADKIRGEESESSYHDEEEEKGNYEEEERSVVSFNVKGKKYFAKLLEQGQSTDEVELLYKSEDGNLFNTGTKISLPEEDFVSEEIDAPNRVAKNWSTQAPITETKSFESIKDENGIVLDYKDVTFKGYASTNESITKGDRIGDYLKRGAFKKTINNFMQNPVMLIDHQNSVREIAGTYTKIYEDKNGLMVEGKISNSPELKNIRFLIAEGHLKTLSIGGMFLYGEDGKSIDEVNLYEISLVAIPMNPDALFSVRNVDEEFFFKKI
jgi:HK97 family phage prohead protease